MASPQKENGYTPISNELLDAILKLRFTATQLKIIFACCRYTYGFSRKEAELSETFIQKATGIKKKYISPALNYLINTGVIKVAKEFTCITSRVITLNKNYEEWSPYSGEQYLKNGTVPLQGNGTVPLQGNGTVPLQGNQDKQTLKQTIKQGNNFNFIPECIKQDVMDFMEFRKKIKSPMTEKAVRILVNKLSLITTNEEEQRQILEQSIMNGWKSVYGLKDGFKPKVEIKPNGIRFVEMEFPNERPRN